MKKIIATLLCGVALYAAGPLRRAPGFCLIDTSGQWQDLADYRGKIVLVEFMKTDCPHCIAFGNVLNGLKQKYGEKLAVLGIANPPDNPQTMLQFVKAHKPAYPILLDQGQVAYAYVRAGGFDQPTVYLVDTNGMIRNSWQYSVLANNIFEGGGLAKEIDAVLAPAAPSKK
jgi:peroxiredoxin